MKKLVIPLVLLAGFASIALLAPRMRPAFGKPSTLAAKPVAEIRRDQAPEPALVPAKTEDLVKANAELRVKSTYKNYRTAVATKNQHLQDALLPQLLKERVTALRIAEEEVARSKTPSDRTIAQETVEALRR